MKTKVILIAAAGLIVAGGALHSGHHNGCPLKKLHEKSVKTNKADVKEAK